MLKSYFITAFRNLKKHKGYSSINILGLAVGIACCVTIFLYVQNELGFDTFYKDAESIYRVYVESTINGRESRNCKTAAPLGSTLVRDFPEVRTSTRIGFFGNHVLKYNDKLYRERHLYTADPNFFEVFSLPLLSGDPRSVLVGPNSIVVTQSTARKYFGDDNPIGKILTADSQGSYVVTGVMKDFPASSSFRCDMLLSMSTYPAAKDDNWLDMSYTTYVVVQKGTDPVIFQQKLKNIVHDHVAPQAESALGISFREFLDRGNAWDLRLQPFTSIYLRSQRDYGIDPNSEWSDQSTSNIDYVYIFSAVAVFILFLAVINFMNLTTAKSGTRFKEIGIKKTLGWSRPKLIGQFLVESVVVSLLSVLLAIVLVEVFLPLFNRLAERELTLELGSNAYTIPGLLLFAVFVGILSGSYPAFYLSSFRPVHLLKSGPERGVSKSTLRSALVVVQFAVSIGLIVSALTMRDQLRFMQNKDLGFDREQLYAVKNFGVPGYRIHALKEELLRNPDIIAVTHSSVMLHPGIPGRGFSYTGRRTSDAISSHFLDVDYDFLETFRIPLLRGRFFAKEFPSDTTAVVINEAMERQCGMEDPVGKELVHTGTQTTKYRIIGVIGDFHYQSLHERIRPLALLLGPVRQPASIVTIRISPANVGNTVTFINEKWKTVTGGEEVFSSFVNQDLAHLYQSEERADVVATVFAGLAISIGCLGLFGLTSFVTEQRKKEIGVRRVLGASVAGVITMLTKDVARWVLLANCAAWPVAWFAMNKWLQNFAYRIDMTWWTFALAGGLTLSVALLTVGWQAIRAATANPVDALRCE